MNTNKIRKTVNQNDLYKSIANQLEKDFGVSPDTLRSYAFIINGNKIFIMTKRVKEFEKIRAVRKGILLAEKLGSKIKISDNVMALLIDTKK
jgi:hypothetical protein